VPSFHLQIISPKRILFEEDVVEITAPTDKGEISILANHTPMVSQLSMGDLVIKKEKGEQIIAVYGGFINIESNGTVTILADNAEHIHEINEQSAIEAIKKAEEAIAKAKASRENFAKGQAELSHTLFHEDHMILAETQAELLMNLTRLKIVRKHHQHHGIKYDK